MFALEVYFGAVVDIVAAGRKQLALCCQSNAQVLLDMLISVNILNWQVHIHMGFNILTM